MLGIGLAMDAFSVSMANGLSEPTMKKSKMYGMAGVFAVFQGVMPFLGWLCVHTIVQYFTVFEKCIPWIALILLVYIGGKMIFEGRHEDSETQQVKTVGAMEIIIQGIATSIDALSVGFTIAEYNWGMMLLAVSVIAAVTFVICATGIRIGRKFGTKLSGKSQIFGGVILILIGIEIFIQGIF
jgi:putative Mn2+ efflux pump MntP